MSAAAGEGVHTTALQSLPLLRRGKVRDIYGLDDSRLLIVQTDRVSAFDVVMNEPMPGKGAALTAMSCFWFDHLRAVAPNHLLSANVEDLPLTGEEKRLLRGRCMVARKFSPLPIEAICRGYLIGSGWKDYQQSGGVCGIALPAGLKLAAKLPNAIFTPSTKAESGHDENIDYAQMEKLVGAQAAAKVRNAAMRLYATAAQYAATRGVIIADTKFEFAINEEGEAVLIDEVLTPDSSRFWNADDWREGENPDSYDKQPLRDHLERVGWNKQPPPPPLPPEVVAAMAKKYDEIQSRLIG